MMAEFKKFVFVIVLIVCAMLIAVSYVSAEVTKWQQLPDLTSSGVDIRLDDADGVTRYVADDFQCTQSGPITDVHFWGSWKCDLKCPITAILVSFYSDDANQPYSKPGQLLWQHRYMTGEFTETLYQDLTPTYEWWWDPYFHDANSMGDHQVWKYDINIDPRRAVRQQGTPSTPQVYWLELQAWLPDSDNYRFGWKTSQEHWNDKAVWDTGYFLTPRAWKKIPYPPGHQYRYLPPDQNSPDMAFAITTGAEPNMPTDPNTKFKQPPDEGPNGIDIHCDRKDQVQRTLADDFVCFETGPITDVHLWGSWKGEPAMKGDVNSIHLSIHSDIPSWQYPYGGDWSIPGPVLWQRDIQVGDFKETLYKTMTYYEGWWDASLGYEGAYIPNGDRQIWQYDIVIPPSEAFIQQGEPNKPVIYWLDVYVQLKSTTPNAQFGWKTSTGHFNDAAVYLDPQDGHWKPIRYPDQHPLYDKNVDMAFSITNKKECIKPWAIDYAAWVLWGKPKCWCYKRQCRGDFDGAKVGVQWVQANDLNALIAAYGKNLTWLTQNPSYICADFDHGRVGVQRVQANDLNILISYYGKNQTIVTCCDLDNNGILVPADKYSFWTN